jgi:hypothetical protein
VYGDLCDKVDRLRKPLYSEACKTMERLVGYSAVGWAYVSFA